ncbi:DNA polymerase III subunit gamma/tau [Mycoplasma marinum]|nr:DNA polymerase III subunit gamma/tau [Mycoplasma marinum]
MSYKALYRTYRPSNFDEIKGQEHITTTLRNIVKSNKISHAYLFSGPRGTGKTSAAKVFANILNCKYLSEDLKPCLKCGLCLEAKKGSSMDIIEIDAASNNGVAEIRELRDNVKYAPTNTKYKVYIIDEVHMLSKGAFNALLKTLEEPPKHAIFILATTEPQKIPVTILSRTQRFNFRRVEDSVLVEHLKDVLTKEGLKYETSAIKLIAKLANGGLRDALSIADQASSYTNGQITFEAISQVFGVVSLESQVKIINFASSKNIEGLLMITNKFIDNGADLTRLSMSLIEIIKDFIIFKKTGQPKLLETLKENQIPEVHLNYESAYNMLDILVELITQLSRSDYPRQAFELAMLKLTKAPQNVFDTSENISPVMENKEPAFSTMKQNDNKEENVEIKVPQKTPELSAPIIKEDTSESLEEIFMEKSSGSIIGETNEIKTDKKVEEKIEKYEPTIPKVDFESIPPQTESDDSLNDLFATQNIKEESFKEEEIIDMEEIEASTQVISKNLERQSISEDIEEDITTTQEIAIGATKTEEIVATKTIATSETVSNQEINTPNEKPEDLLSLFSSPTKPEEIKVSKETTYTVADIINLLVQADRETHLHVKNSWNSIVSYSTNPNYSEYVSLIESSKLISAGKKYILLSSSDVGICSRINEVKFNKKFIELIKEVFGEVKNVFAITKNQFMDVKERYTTLAKTNSLPQPEMISVPSLEEKEKTQAHKLGEDLFGDLFSA